MDLKARVVLLALMILWLCVFAPSSVSSQITPEMVQAAKKEGGVMLYGAFSIKASKEVGDLFEKRYGIKLKHWRGDATALLSRVLAEARTGGASFDVLVGNEGIMSIVKDKGILDKFDPPAAAKFPKQFKDPEHWMTPWRALPYGVNYNTNVIKPDEAPKTWEALLDPRWKKNFAMANPGVHTTTLQFVVSLDKLFGEKWFDMVKGWARQEPRLAQSLAPAVQMLIAGEVPVAIAYIKSKFEFGGPIDYVRMDKYLASVSAVGVNKKALHPNAARLFTNFFLEPESQRVFANIGEYVFHPDVEHRFKDVKREQLVIMHVPAGAEFEAWGRKLQEIFK